MIAVDADELDEVLEADVVVMNVDDLVDEDDDVVLCRVSVDRGAVTDLRSQKLVNSHDLNEKQLQLTLVQLKSWT